MGRKVFVVGVGMTKFEKPGSREWDYPEMAQEAGTKALEDAGISYEDVEQACVGYCYGESTCGERAVYGLGLTGIPIYNVNNNCATGSTALFMAKQFVEGGIADCAMAVGFEKMEKGSLGIKYTDRTMPTDKHFQIMVELRGFEKAPGAPQMFGNAAREHMEKYGTTAEQFAKIGWKNHKHSVNNPYSQFQDEYSLEDILNAKMIYAPLTKLQCCPTSDGAGAAILCSEEFMKKRGLQAHAVEIAGMAMATDFPSTFEEKSCIKIVGVDMTRKAAEKVYEQSGLGPTDVDVVELHDCFSANELITYEALGLCPEGKGGQFVDEGAQTYGGQVDWQLRGQADKRRVKGAKVALQHDLGLGGAAVVTLYRALEDAS
jgi:sterol carrier protein 2